MTQPDLLTTGQAAQRLGVSDETVRRWADDRKLRHVRLPSGQLRFRPADLEEVLLPVEPSDPARSASLPEAVES